MREFRRKYFGDKAFYTYALGLAIPMIIQNLITNFVSMLDNIMVGQVGTLQMSGVSIVNQFVFIFNITIFGAVSGAGIFGTQFFGKSDHEGHKYTVRFRLMMIVLLLVVFSTILRVFETPLISLFLSDQNDPRIAQETLNYGIDYLRIIILSFIPFGIGQAYASAIMECGETSIPMMGSMAAIGVNLVLDYGLIFGKLGMPCMGVKGAALATVIAKCIEAAVMIIWAHTHLQRNQYLIGLYKSFKVPVPLAKDIIKKGFPLLINEFLWSLGMSTVAQCYSVRGIEVVAARNISSTITNLFNVFFVQMGHCLGIVVGLKLGEGDMEGAKLYNGRMMMLSEMITSAIAIIMIPVSFVFPKIYNTESSVMQLATTFILISAVAMPIWSYTNAAYFTLRSGGRTGITFLFDFVFTWVVMIPLAFVLTNYTTIGIEMVFAIVTFSEILKVILGYFMVRSDIWVNNIVNTHG